MRVRYLFAACMPIAAPAAAQGDTAASPPITMSRSAPKQQALGRWYSTGAEAAAGVYNDPGDRHDNTYVGSDAAVALPGTPLTGKARIGHSRGNPGLSPNATSVAPTGRYWDWSPEAGATRRNLTLGVAPVGTDISGRAAAYLRPSFSKGQDGTGNIAGGTALVSLTAAF